MLTFLKNIPQTFYSAAFYQNLALKGKGLGISFLLLITLVNITGFGPSLLEGSSTIMDEQEILLNALPDMEIKDGTLTIEGEQQQTFTFLKEVEGGPFNIILDLKAPTPELSVLSKKMKDEQIMVWVNKDSIFYFNHNENAIQRQPISKYDNAVITHEDWVQASQMIKNILWPTTLIAYIIMLFVTHLALAFIGGLFLWILAPLFKRTLDLRGATRVSAAAKVPVAFIFLIMTPTPIFQTLFWFGFAIFGLLAVPQGKTEKG